MWYYRLNMDAAEKLLNRWRQQLPRDGADCEQALTVMDSLGMTVKRNSQGHYQAFHKALIGSTLFPCGSLTMNCHAFGTPGKAHPSAIKDLVRAARIIQEAHAEEERKAEEEQSDENDTD